MRHSKRRSSKRRSSKRGTRSKTHPGRLNYTTKKGDKVFHRRRHYIRKNRRPYTKKSSSKRTKSGGSLLSVINTALVPFSLLALNNVFGKKHKKTHKRRR